MAISRAFCRPLLAVAGLAFAVGAHAGDKAMDTNGDGLISAAEHEAGAREMFMRMDANHDGVVTADELEAVHGQMAPEAEGQPQMSAADKIKAIDVNGDGAISAADHEAGSRAMFTKMDADHDGKLSAAELQAGHQGLMQKNPG